MPHEERYRICPLCEATCGLALNVDGAEVLRIRGDDQDSFSEGYICPKGPALKDIHSDSDRLRVPLIKRDGQFIEASWDDAFAEIDRRLTPIIQDHGKAAVGAYVGNPTVHNMSLVLYSQALLRALGSPNIFTATTVDQMPKQFACGLMFGSGLSIPIPDIDRTHYLLILGANPLDSNGSLLTAPNFGQRLKRIQQRGGYILVVDPRRTKTADLADEHLFIRPGTDAYFLFAIVHTLYEESLVDVDSFAQHLEGLDTIRQLAGEFSPEAVAPHCGIDAPTIRRIAREFAQAESAAVYARMGTCTQTFGTLASWLPEVIHVLTGNFDRPGGALFTKPAHGAANTQGTPGVGKGLRFGRRTSRVRGLPEIFGELPVACLAEEIETPGDGQIRVLFTIAGNPVVSTPNGLRLSEALASLDFMISLDIFLNETTRHADVILPGLSPLETSHYDFVFTNLSVRNHARYSPAVFAKPEDQQPEWETLLRLAAIVTGMGPAADTAFLDDMVISTLIQREAALEASAICGCDTEDIMSTLASRRGPERILDFMLRVGPYGEGFGKNPDGLTLDELEAAPHGIDLGPLQPRIPEVLRTPSGKIELAPEPIVADVDRLRAQMSESAPELVLIGRRHLRSCNSWMHNVPRLVSGRNQCTLQMHPGDAERMGLDDGDTARVASRVGQVDAPVEVTDIVAPGVVSLPHGWGHDDPTTRLSVAHDHAGVNSNRLSDETLLDGPTGTAVLNGIPVTVTPITAR
jgi:anaerobic selenocysteine-containing dehydrogenase